MDASDKQQFLFTQLVLMFHTATMHQLGKIKNPVTDKIERDLEGAKNSIDLLDMLKAKTRGNLGEQEERLLTSLIQELKLNYVDEVNKKPAGEEQQQTPPVQAEGGPTPA